jgi:hypothetical protein
LAVLGLLVEVGGHLCNVLVGQLLEIEVMLTLMVLALTGQ